MVVPFNVKNSSFNFINRCHTNKFNGKKEVKFINLIKKEKSMHYTTLTAEMPRSYQDAQVDLKLLFYLF